MPETEQQGSPPQPRSRRGDHLFGDLVVEALEQARQRAGYALFVMRCPLAGGEIESQQWQRAVARLVNHLDGLPLAIELAAARAATMTPGEILDQIEGNLRPLGDGPVDQELRHRAMQGALDWSARLLSMPARSAYETVSVFPADFARGDVPPLLSAIGSPAADSNALLDELLAARLLARMPDGDRSRMLHLPHAHARALAVAHGHWPMIVATRLNDVCARLGEEPVDFESPRYATRLDVVNGIEDDAIAVLDHARNTDPARSRELPIVAVGPECTRRPPSVSTLNGTPKASAFGCTPGAGIE